MPFSNYVRRGVELLRKHGSEFSWLATVGIVSVIISLALVLYFEPKSLFWKIILAAIAELGFACIIAYFIIIAVDYREKLEFRHHIQRSERRLASKALLSYMLDLELPKSISDKLQTLIASSSFIKTYQTITFRINRIDDRWVELIGHYEYVAYNAASTPAEETILFYYDFDPNTPEDMRENTGIRKITIETRRSERDEFGMFEQSAVPAASAQSASKRVELLLEPSEQVRVRTETRGIKQLSDNEVWRNQLLCEGLKGEIHFDPREFLVGYSVIHPGQPIEGRSDGSSILRVSVEEPLLRSNGVLLWWKYLKEGQGK